MDHLQDPAAPPSAADAGLSLVEMLVALFLLAIAVTAMAGGLISALTGEAKNDRRSVAVQLAGDRLEQLRRLPFAQVRPEAVSVPLPVAPNGTSSATPSIKGTTYTIVTQRSWCADQWNGAGGAADLDYVKFVVSVSWTVKGSAQSITSGSFRAPVRGDRAEAEFMTSSAPLGAGSCA